jgi:3-deoxy-D-manno-octulosonic-acid transferase
MLFWIYNLLITFAIPFLIPFWEFRALFHKKRALYSHFFPKIAKSPGCIWIHAVSLGEVNTAESFLIALHEKFKDLEIFVSCVTETGFHKASQIPFVHAFYLPFDHPLFLRRVFNKINPKVLYFIEGDVWPSLSHMAKQRNIAQMVISAKLSEKSLSFYQKFPKVFSFVFGELQKVWVQDELMKQRFMLSGFEASKIQILGNLKSVFSTGDFLTKNLKKDLDAFFQKNEKKTILIASTHNQEEKLILEALKDEINQYNIIIAPRHPKRFKEVADCLNTLKIHYHQFSNQKKGDDAVYLLDTIGVLKHLYPLCDLCIMGGSFVQGIGGHNVLEPLFFGTPVLFGPFMEKQEGTKLIVHQFQMGEMATLTDLSIKTKQWMAKKQDLLNKKEALCAYNQKILLPLLDEVKIFIKK